MSNLPLFYKQVVPLSNTKHKDLWVVPVSNFNHARESNSLYIAAAEFVRASKEYPIFFGRNTDNSFFPVVILGLKTNTNMFINEKGEWMAGYIPAYARRYPFILAGDNAGGNFAVCIDESYSGFNRDKKGQQLFTEDGSESEMLKQSVAFLKDYQNHIQLTNLFCKQLVDLDILEAMQANISLSDGDNYSLGGFWGVNRERLKELPADKLKSLVQSDYLELIYAHLSSRDNLNRLLERFGKQ